MLLLWGRHHLVFKAVGSVIQWDYHWCCMHQPANSFTKRLYSKRNTICRMHSEICGLTRNKGSRGGSALVKLLSYLQKGTSKGFDWNLAARNFENHLLMPQPLSVLNTLWLTKGVDVPVGTRKNVIFSFLQYTADLFACRTVSFHPLCLVPTSSEGDFAQKMIFQ